MTTSRAARLFASTAITAACLGTVAHAQNAAPGAGGDAPVEMAEVIVTAQKRSENAQDVPKQVSVVSQAQLATAGVTRLTELQTAIPSVTATDQNQNSKNPGIRGIAPIANSVGVQSQTGIIVDDIPQSTFSTLAFELSDVERIEVFPGPQSTLSGRNAAGGLINFVTRTPSSTASYEGKIEQTTDRQTRVTLFATGPLADNLDFSASLLFNKWAGPYRNVLRDGDHAGGFNTKGVRAKLRWNPIDSFTATLTGYYLSTNRTTPPILAGETLIQGSPNATFLFDTLQRPLTTLYPGIQIGEDNRSIYSPENGRARTRDRGGTLRLDYDIDSLGTLSSLTSYTYSTQPRSDILFGAPQDSLVVSVSDFSQSADVQSKYFTQEIRLTSPDSEPLTYLLGAIYTRTRLFQPNSRLQLFPVDWDRTVSIDSTAVFGRGTYELTPNDSLTLGARYQHDEIGYTWAFHSVPRTTVQAFSEGDNGYGFFGMEASYKHDFSDDVNAYVTYSRSETGKAYDVEDNNVAMTGTLEPLDSESVNNWEIGLKSQFFDRRLTFNISAFRARYKNYQIQSLTPGDIGSPPVIRLRAIGKVASQGVELTTNFLVTPDLRLSFSGAYTDTFIQSFPGATCYNTQTAAQGCIDGTQGDLSGLNLPYSPKWKFTIGGDYSLPLGDEVDLNLGAFFLYQGRQHYDVLGDPASYQKGYGVLNLYFGPAAHDGRWSLQAFVNNVFDKRYFATVQRSGFYNTPAGQAVALDGYLDRASYRYAGVRLGFRY